VPIASGAENRLAADFSFAPPKDYHFGQQESDCREEYIAV
jgi:hypothetical protein